jgi:hypothetical protein
MINICSIITVKVRDLSAGEDGETQEHPSKKILDSSKSIHEN